MRLLPLALALAGGCAAPRAEPPAPASDPAWRAGRSAGGTFELAWRSLAGSVPRNQAFDLEVLLRSGGRPVIGAELAVSGWMDAHGHGLIAAPEVRETEPGRYLVTNLLLHMRGHWRLIFDVVKDGYSERAEFELDVGAAGS